MLPEFRRRYGLPRRPTVASLDDERARRIRVGGDPITFEAIVGTSSDQVAVAPGVLRRTWREGGRRYFHYASDTPINNEYGVFSAGYALHEEQRGAVAIQIFHHPGHAANLTRMLASVRASLDHYTRQFGPYPYRYIRLIENPGAGMGVHTEAATIEYGEGFSSSIQATPRRTGMSSLQSSPTESRAAGGACRLRPRTSRERGYWT